MDRYYTGVGSRETPGPIQATERDIARGLSHHGFILRSGHCRGSDKAFEAAVSYGRKQIFLPWIGFEYAREGAIGHFNAQSFDNYHEASRLAALYHPNWDGCDATARKLLTRNVYEVLGPDLQTPSEFVVCYTKDGKRSGGTGHTLRIAEGYNLPIFDLGSTTGFDSLIKHGESL